MPNPAADEAPTTGQLLMWVSEALKHHFESSAARFELTPAQARALLLLEDPHTMAAVAGQLRCDASNVTGIADRLATRGLVTREPAPGDRRVKRLALTDAGRQLRGQLEYAVLQESPVLAALADEELATLRRLLEKLLTHVAGDHCPDHC